MAMYLNVTFRGYTMRVSEAELAYFVERCPPRGYARAKFEEWLDAWGTRLNIA